MPLTRRHFLMISAYAWAAPVAAQSVPTVAAAASLRFALPVLAQAFQTATGLSLRLTYGSSGTLARQIQHGAPFELFLSADEKYVEELARIGAIPDQGTVYALGRLAVAVPLGSDLAVDAELNGVEAALSQGALSRFAIASPEHAPYGMRAKEALMKRGLWHDLEPYLVFGENVAQAAQFALSGNADGGLIAASMAVSGPMSERSRHAIVPSEWHAPLSHRMALTHRASETATAFFDFLLSETAQSVLTDHGFSAPAHGAGDPGIGLPTAAGGD